MSREPEGLLKTNDILTTGQLIFMCCAVSLKVGGCIDIFYAM